MQSELYLLDPQKIWITFWILIAIATLLEYFLDYLNLKNFLSNRNKIPDYAASFMDPVTYEKSVSYTLTKMKFAFITEPVYFIILIFAIIYGFFPFLDEKIIGILQNVSTSRELSGVIFFLALSVLQTLITIPSDLYSTFVIEERFGFNKMTLKLYFIDLLKSLLISVLLFFPLGYSLLFILYKLGKFWWLYSFLVLELFQLVILFIYPVFIAPLFNKFTELTEGELFTEILKLKERTGLTLKKILIMDGSKRSTHSNAYFTGIGKSKQIVLFDTLISKLKTPEVLAVLAHEIGHMKKKHILKSFILSSLFSLVIFYLVSLLIDTEPLYKAFGFKEISYPAGLVIISIFLSPLTGFLKPFFHFYSRKKEFEADEFSAITTNDPDSLANSLIVLNNENLSNLTPHPLYAFFNYSHPTLAERLKFLKTLNKN